MLVSASIFAVHLALELVLLSIAVWIVHMCALVCFCMCVYMHACVCLGVCMCMHICMCMWMCTCMHACVCVLRACVRMYVTELTGQRQCVVMNNGQVEQVIWPLGL